jgi:hypothetical protein
MRPVLDGELVAFGSDGKPDFESLGFNGPPPHALDLRSRSTGSTRNVRAFAVSSLVRPSEGARPGASAPDQRAVQSNAEVVAVC